MENGITVLRMSKDPHPFYAGLLRWIADHPDWSSASLSAKISSGNSTIRKAVDAGSAPSYGTIKKAERLTGLSEQQIIDWPNDRALSSADLDAQFQRAFAALPTEADKRRALAILEVLARDDAPTPAPDPRPEQEP